MRKLFICRETFLLYTLSEVGGEKHIGYFLFRNKLLFSELKFTWVKPREKSSKNESTADGSGTLRSIYFTFARVCHIFTATLAWQKSKPLIHILLFSCFYHNTKRNLFLDHRICNNIVPYNRLLDVLESDWLRKLRRWAAILQFTLSIRRLGHKEINGRLFRPRRKEKQLARMQIAKCIVVFNTFACEARDGWNVEGPHSLPL